MATPWKSEEERAEYFEKQEVIADCSKCVSEEVCKYRHDYECPHFKNKAGFAEVVYCKDCKHHGKFSCAMSGFNHPKTTKNDGFCHLGERKEIKK